MTRVFIGRLVPALLALTCYLAWADAATAQLDRRNAGVYDPSTIIKCGDDFWLFFTGRGIPSYRSKDLIDWEHGPSVFSDAPPRVAAAVPNKRGNGFALEVTVPVNTTATIRLPAAEASEVREGGRLLTQARGVESVQLKGGRVVLEVDSGKYNFRVFSK